MKDVRKDENMKNNFLNAGKATLQSRVLMRKRGVVVLTAPGEGKSGTCP